MSLQCWIRVLLSPEVKQKLKKEKLSVIDGWVGEALMVFQSLFQNVGATERIGNMWLDFLRILAAYINTS